MNITDIESWRHHRRDVDPDGHLNDDVGHQLKHVVKALGYLADALEHDDHNEADDLDPKRVADAVIHAVWLGAAMGFDVTDLVEQRIISFDDGFTPQKEVIP